MSAALDGKRRRHFRFLPRQDDRAAARRIFLQRERQLLDRCVERAFFERQPSKIVGGAVLRMELAGLLADDELPLVGGGKNPQRVLRRVEREVSDAQRLGRGERRGFVSPGTPDASSRRVTGSASRRGAAGNASAATEMSVPLLH